MKKITFIFCKFFGFVLFISTASADIPESHKNPLNKQLKGYCGDLALYRAQTTFDDVNTTVTNSSIQDTTCSYNPFSACEFAVKCEYILTTHSSNETANHRGYQTLKIYTDKKAALGSNKASDIRIFSIGGRKYYVTHSSSILELFFMMD